MAFWKDTFIIPVKVGTNINDGTGDPIRTAFTEVNNSLANVNAFLSGTSGSDATISFYNANVQVNFGVTGRTSLTNVFASNVLATSANITGNLSANKLIANTGLYSSTYTQLSGNLVVTSPSYFYGNINAGSAIVPTAGNQFDLGSPELPFRNIYGIIQNTIQNFATNDAGLLQLHANLNTSQNPQPDVGIFGKFYKDSANSFAFFGHQQTTSDFVYKITSTDSTLTNSVVSDGVYGNAHLGSLLLSNTVSTSANTLIVSGKSSFVDDVYTSANLYSSGNVIANSGIFGNLSVAGNISGNLSVEGVIYSKGSPVLAVDQIGLYSALFPAGQVYGNLIIANVGSTTYNLTVTGNTSVGGNVTASNFNGNLSGTLLTAEQPNITSLGRLTGLDVSGGTIQASAVQTTTIGVSVLNVTSALNLTGGSLSGLAGLGVSGTIVAGSLNATTVGNVGTTLIGTNGFIGTLNASAVNSATIGNVGSAITGSSLTATTVTGTNGFIGTLRASTINSATLGNIGANVIGTGTYLTSLTGSSVIGTVGTANISLWSNVTTSSTNAIFYPQFSSAVSGNLQTFATSNFSINPSSGNVLATNFVGTHYGSVYGTVLTPAQPSITSLGTLTGLTVSGNTIVNSSVYGQGVYDNSNRVASTSTGAGNITINSNGSAYLTVTGPGVTSVGSATAIPVISTDQYGRVVSLSSASISTTLNLAGTSGTGTVALANQSLTFAGSFGVTANASGQTVTISTSQDLRTTASPTFVGIAGTLSTAAQTNITSVGTLTGLNISGNVKRTAAGSGMLDGNYNTAELTTTTGAIYTLGGTAGYYPTATSLNTMYGIGYTNTGTNNFGIATNTGAPSSQWGMYVASAGIPRIFLSADNGGVYASRLAGQLLTNAQPFVTSVGTLSSLNVSGIATAGSFTGAGTGLTGTAVSLTAGAALNGGVTSVNSNTGAVTVPVIGQSWISYNSTQRQQDVTYTNDTGKTIQVVGNFGCNSGGNGRILVNGNEIAYWAAQFNGCGGYSVNMPVLVPPGATYMLSSMGGSFRSWWELR